MEMESSRRSSMDRSRELPGLKKPRLADDTSDRDRAANGVSSRATSANQQVNPRVRANEREREEREDSIRGTVSSSASSYQQQQQELVAQYKTALAELTFNSKPIITNLTIIAGENLHAAKGIAATICNNVIEVPSEQKLPSLYLLDSIVKNIGRDYIKYFAGRLPEVFCKAYKQVDSSIHPGMKHLFGTWKGVFPPAPLQIIEKELGFPPVINSSSGTTTSRSDSQTQRPAHSIHVNPKYLEARQRLQQTRAKEITSDDGGDMVISIEDAERSDKTAITGSTRQWTNLSGKMPNIQRPQRELSNDPIYEKKGLRDIKDHQFSSILARQTDLGAGRISERTKERDEEKSYYGVGGTASETLISRRNGFDANHSYGDHRASRFAQTDHQLPSVHLNNINKSIQATSKNWKNFEEEEYMWDDTDSKSTDYGGNNTSTKGVWNIDKADKCASLQRGQWIPLESEQPDLRRDKLDNFPRLKPSVGEDRVPLFRDIDDNHLQPHSQWDADSRRHLETSADLLSVGHAASGHHASTIWPQREPLLPVPGLNQMSSRFSGQSEGGAVSHSSGPSTNSISPLARPGFLSHSHSSSLSPSTNIIPGPSGIFGQKRQQPLQPPSPSAHPPPSFQPLQHQKLQNVIDHDHPQPPFSQMGQKPMQLPGHLNRGSHASVIQDTSPGLSQNQSQQSHSLQNLPQPSSTLFTQLRHHPRFLHQSQPELPLQQAQTQSQSLIHSDKPQTSSQSSGTPHSHGFSGDITSTNSIDASRQSSTSNLLAAIMKSGLLQNNPTSGLQNFNVQPPLPSGPPPIQALTSSAPMVTPSSLLLRTSQGNVPSLTAPITGVVLPPLPPGPPPSSSLVSTSSQKSNTTGAVSNPFSSLLSSLVAKGIISSPATEMPAKVPDPSIEFSSSSSVQIPSTSDKLTVPPPAKEPSISKPSAPTGVASLAPNATELEDVLGIDFKPEIIRELHPLVTSSLFDDLKHQCDTCGLRFKLQEQLHSHLDLHTSEKSELGSSDELSRKWYSNASNWISEDTEPPQVPVTTTSLEDVALTNEKCKPMVPADERQSICALCGEPFEDFYSHERDEWMYKGTVYMDSPERKGDTGSMDEMDEHVLIVHAKCVSSSADNKDVAENDKMVWTDG